ncbi:F-box and WD repeat domain containing protein 10B isoform X3 [Danio rerio]|uniref:F-box and WD repeat domain containing protein 10B isoform X3 n=2 Tax=Danio rerio TaxID=7955 RepID=A0AC58GYT0_DANRE
MTGVKCLRGEAGDSVLEWSCRGEDGDFNICGRCQTCILSEQLHHIAEWINKAGWDSRKRFITGILVRCQSLQILESLQSVLQVTSGKDYTYARSRALPEDTMWSMDGGGPDGKIHGLDVLETWEWFRKSPDWTKSKYVLGLLTLCDTHLLHMLGNLVRVLIIWEKHRFLQFSNSVKDSKSLKSICNQVELDSDSCDGPDPALTVVPRSSKSLSGVSCHIDFIRRLPVNIAKMTLGQLDKVSLSSCRRVSKHWQSLTEEILTEMEVKKRVKKQAMIFQGNSTSKVNPVYAKICEVLVPISEGDKHFQHGGTSPRHTQSQGQVLDSLYKGFKTEKIQLEERNVYCGVYNTSVLLERCWNLKTGMCMMIFHGHFGTINCLDLVGDRLVSGAKDCRVKVWNLQTGKCVENLKFKHPKPIMCVKMSETLVISSCSGGQIRIWSIQTALLIRQISGHQGAVLCLCFDQWHILSGGSDGVVKAWSTNSSFKKCLRTFQHPKEVLAMSFLFLRIITGCMDGKIRIFNFLNGDCLRVIKTNMKQCPVLSLHMHHNTVVVNTRGSVLMLQFAEVQWDYSARAVRDLTEQFHVSPKNVPRSTERATQGGSSGLKSHPHHSKNLSTTNMQHAQVAQRESTRAAMWSKLQAYSHSRTSINLQSEFITRPRSVLSAGKPVSGYKGFQNRVSHTPSTATSSSDKKTKNDIKHSVLSRSEKAVRERVRKRGPHHPVTPERILLRAGSSQQGHNSDPARSNMELNARVRDAWGPDACRQPSFQTSTKKPSETNTPFTMHSVDLNPQSSLQAHSTSKQSQRSLKVNKIDPLNVTCLEDDKTPQGLLVRQTSMPKHCHEDLEMTSKSSLRHIQLDPYKRSEVFQLRTDTQMEAFLQECTRQQQVCKNGSGDKR